MLRSFPYRSFKGTRPQPMYTEENVGRNRQPRKRKRSVARQRAKKLLVEGQHECAPMPPTAGWRTDLFLSHQRSRAPGANPVRKKGPYR